MGKRSNFERRERDFYPTPIEAVWPLLPHLPKSVSFYEPCSGEGHLIKHLELAGHKCFGASDIASEATKDATTDVFHGDFACFITNPPWDRDVLHPLIHNLRVQKPTILLFDADWMHTRQSQEYMVFCTTIVSVGRVKWIPDSLYTGKDNCCWYVFNSTKTITRFIGR